TSLPVEDIKARAEAQEINLRYSSDGDIGISIDETIREKDIYDIFAIFNVDVNRKFRGNTFQPVHDVLPNSSLTERENELAVGFKKYEKGKYNKKTTLVQ
ncbi:putative Glycine dehydrogenase, partial [Daphnia magna]